MPFLSSSTLLVASSQLGVPVCHALDSCFCPHSVGILRGLNDGPASASCAFIFIAPQNQQGVKSYIATQAPLNHTVEGMLWFCHSAVVMLAAAWLSTGESPSAQVAGEHVAFMLSFMHVSTTPLCAFCLCMPTLPPAHLQPSDLTTRFSPSLL